MCISILIGITIVITFINITDFTVTIAASTITIARIDFLFIKTNPIYIYEQYGRRSRCL